MEYLICSPRSTVSACVAFVKFLKDNFDGYSLTYSTDGRIPFSAFYTGWDETYCLRHVEDKSFKEIRFFGDETYRVCDHCSVSRNLVIYRNAGDNDYKIFAGRRTIGHTVTSPGDTQ
jgi:phosphomannomutase